MTPSDFPPCVRTFLCIDPLKALLILVDMQCAFQKAGDVVLTPDNAEELALLLQALVQLAKEREASANILVSTPSAA